MINLFTVTAKYELGHPCYQSRQGKILILKGSEDGQQHSEYWVFGFFYHPVF
jgi:hypothetical protein